MKKFFSLPVFLLTIISSGLLVLAFPPFDYGWIGWFALAPFFMALQGKRKKAAFRTGYLLGILFFSGTLFWFFHLTKWFSFWAGIGVVLLFLYLSLYMGFFALGVSLVKGRGGWREYLLIPSWWVALEFLRGHLFSGFDWVSLAHSQYQYLAVIQIADLTGFYGVSFMMIMVNMGVSQILLLVLRPKKALSRCQVLGQSAVILLLMAGLMIYGRVRLQQWDETIRQEHLPSSRLAVIQGNISQQTKWNNDAWGHILNQYQSLSEKTLAYEPDLIIWPESMLPGFYGEDWDVFYTVEDFVQKMNTDFLVGSVVSGKEGYYNSALYIDTSGRVIDMYHKMHLVPFGEYFPLRMVLSPIAEALGMEDFQSGKTPVLLPLFEKKERKVSGQFAVLICFEDVVSRLVRRFVMQGAELLVNVTNDGWFRDSSAPKMHLQASIFRSVENRRFMVRAANTGVSAFVDPTGKIYNKVKGKKGKDVAVSGFSVAEVKLIQTKTFYSQFGDIFVYLCLILSGIGMLFYLSPFGKRKRK